MNKMKSLLAIAIVFSLTAAAHAQRHSSRRSSVLLNVGKPAVYISFLRTAELEPLRTGYGRKHLIFHVTNNTRWAIWLAMNDVPKGYGDAGLFYAIEGEEKSEIRIDARCHVCSVNPVGPGRSVVFSVPADYAAQDTNLRIEYAFSWERDNEGVGGTTSEHSVVFSFSTLPKSALPSEALSNNGMQRTRTSAAFFIFNVLCAPLMPGVRLLLASSALAVD